MSRWYDVPGFEGVYQINTLGECRSLDRVTAYGRKKKGQILKAYSYKGHYLVYDLRDKEGNRKPKSVHRLLAEMFISNPENKTQVNHKDGDKLNNALDNLEWVSPSENIQHAIDIGVHKYKRGLENHNSKLSEQQVKEIKHLRAKYGYGSLKISHMFPVGRTAIQNILDGKTYKDVV